MADSDQTAGLQTLRGRLEEDGYQMYLGQKCHLSGMLVPHATPKLSVRLTLFCKWLPFFYVCCIAFMVIGIFSGLESGMSGLISFVARDF